MPESPFIPESPSERKKERKSQKGCYGLITIVALFLFATLFLSPVQRVGDLRPMLAAEQAEELRFEVTVYHRETGEYPVELSTSEDADVLAEGAFLRELLNYSPDSFYEAKQREGKWVRGLVDDPEEPRLLDPWGNVFSIRIDSDGDGVVLVGDRALKTDHGIFAWSPGPDSDPDTWEDNAPDLEMVFLPVDRNRAQRLAAAIAKGLYSYYKAKGSYPSIPGWDGESQVVFEGQAVADLLDHLSNHSTEEGGKYRALLKPEFAAENAGVGERRSGVVRDGEVPKVIDPWGNPFYLEKAPGESSYPALAVSSAGPDGDLDAELDNIQPRWGWR